MKYDPFQDRGEIRSILRGDSENERELQREVRTRRKNDDRPETGIGGALTVLMALLSLFVFGYMLFGNKFMALIGREEPQTQQSNQTAPASLPSPLPPPPPPPPPPRQTRSVAPVIPIVPDLPEAPEPPEESESGEVNNQGRNDAGDEGAVNENERNKNSLSNNPFEKDADSFDQSMEKVDKDLDGFFE